MELIEEIKKYLKDTLSEKRYQHSIGVMQRATELAEIYGVNLEKAKICGLLHDIAKEMTVEQSLKYAEENNIFIDKVEKINTGLLHGKIGADIAKKKFNISKDMQKAIEYHTTTNPQMDMLAKIVYVSDKTELGRDNKYNVEYERLLANKDIDKAVVYIINEGLKNMILKDKIIHPRSIETRNYILLNSNKNEDK